MLQEDFIRAARAARPGINDAAIARAAGITRQSLHQRRFKVSSAVEAWNRAYPQTPVVYHRPRVTPGVQA